MTTTGNRGGGRPSKGERRFFGTRLPMDQAELLMAVAPAQGLCVSEFIADVIVEKLEALAVAGPSGASASNDGD